MHRPNPPSIDPGVMAFVWAVLLAVFVYFGLKAVGASGAFSLVLALLAFAAIWLFVRLRGEDRPGSSPRSRTGAPALSAATSFRARSGPSASSSRSRALLAAGSRLVQCASSRASPRCFRTAFIPPRASTRRGRSHDPWG